MDQQISRTTPLRTAAAIQARRRAAAGAAVSWAGVRGQTGTATRRPFHDERQFEMSYGRNHF